MSGRAVISESVFASSVFPTPAGPSMSTGRPIRAARNTTVDTRRLAMYRASLNRCWTSSTDSNMMAPLLLSFGHCSRHFATLRPPTGRVQCHMADAARYHRLQLLLTLAGLGLSLAYLLALIVTDGGQVLARAAAGITPARWGQVALVALALGVGQGVLGLPLRLIRGYWLPRRFGLLHQPLTGWLGDQLKAALIGGALGLAAVEVVYALLALTPHWWLAALALDGGVGILGLAGPADPAGLPWLALVALVLGLVQMPLANGFSRWIERQADDFALATTGNASAFVGAMERLAGLNLAERRPSRLKEIVLYSHPALERRLARAAAAAKRGGLA